MPSIFQTGGGAVWAEKPAGAKFDYTLTWTLEAGDPIQGNPVWECVPQGPTISDTSVAGANTIGWIAGGAVGGQHIVTVSITTLAGRKDQQSFVLIITDPAAAGAGTPSAFPSLALAVQEFRRNRLVGMLAESNPDTPLTDEFLLGKLIAAESTIAHDLGVFTSPREMIPPGTPQAERDALTAAGNVLAEEPGYDYDPALFQGNTWGLIELRQTPAINVTRIWFTYPGLGSPIWEVPISWHRLDKKPGYVNLVPDGAILDIPLNAFLLSAIGGGRKVPLMVQVRYRAGLENAARDYPELLELIRLQAALEVLKARFIPGSGSVSADGLSQSITFTAKDYQDDINAKKKALKTAIKGITGGLIVV